MIGMRVMVCNGGKFLYGGCMGGDMMVMSVWRRGCGGWVAVSVKVVNVRVLVCLG